MSSFGQDEAAVSRDRLSYNPDNLNDASRADPRTRAPYRWDQLTETAIHREILTIASTENASTRFFYNKGSWTDKVEENWVVRWYLWHSFRYRDNREKPRGQNADHPASPTYGGRSISLEKLVAHN